MASINGDRFSVQTLPIEFHGTVQCQKGNGKIGPWKSAHDITPDGDQVAQGSRSQVVCSFNENATGKILNAGVGFKFPNRGDCSDFQISVVVKAAPF